MLREAVRGEKADFLLLGGLDSSCLAALERKIPAITVGMQGMGEQLDLHYAKLTHKHLKMDWRPIIITKQDGIDNLRLVIRATRTYDTALLNDVALYIAVNRIIDLLGTRHITVRSGEPADTLFRGYNGTYFLEKSELNSGIDNSVERLMPLALLERSMGIKVDYPYMNTEVKAFAKTLEAEENVVARMIPGGIWDTHPDNVRNRRSGPWYPFGKMTLRRAFHNDLPSQVISRRKAEIQFGSGTDILRREYLPRTVDYKEVMELKADSGEGEMYFRDRAHVAMYKIYRDEGFKPRAPLAGETKCDWCHGGIPPKPDGTKGTHCYTCGWDDADRSNDESWIDVFRIAKPTKTNK